MTKLAIDRKQGLSTTRTKLAIILPLLTLLLLIELTSQQLVNAYSGNANSDSTNNDPPETTTYLQRPTDPSGRPQLMVAIYCGSGIQKSGSLFYNQYLEIDTKKWRSDRSASAFCTQDKREILNYCRKVYQKHDIRNIVESSRPYKLDNWCRIGSPKRKCRTRLSVKPYRCLEGTFQSDALLVPERCLFDHVHNKSICESSDHWNNTATENCSNKDMKLQSFAMLQPCGLGVFSGVEFVCCPRNSNSDSKSTATKESISAPEGNSFAQAANGMGNWPSKDTKYEVDEKANDIKTDNVDSSSKKHEATEKQQDDLDAEESEEDEYDDEEDEYDDDNSSWNGDKTSSSSSTSPATTSTTTTTTERPIDHYLSHFDLAHEHDDFRKAELAVEESYKDKISHVMKEWNQLDSRYGEMKKKDPQQAEEFKKKMTHQFQKTIEALEEEGAAQRHQLASMHAERAMAIINRRKKAAMDCLTQALDKIPIRTRQVERCIVRLLKALEKDRSHTLRQYKNLLTLNTREALREKRIILDHLVTLNRAANQSITMLDRSPVLVDKLKSKIVELWHHLRGIPVNEPIERESELKIMEKFEEEVAMHKIEHERKRLAEQQEQVVQEAPQESPAKQMVTSGDNNKENHQAEVAISSQQPQKSPPINNNRIEQPQSLSSPMRQEPMASQAAAPVSSSHPQSIHSSRQDNNRMSNEIHYQIDSAKFSHLKVDPTHHELSYSVKREPINGQSRFGYPALLISSCTLVLVLAIFGMRHYSKNSSRAYRRQGFAEVGRTCPEEKSMSSMQFNGYENPAYKFFEAEA